MAWGVPKIGTVATVASGNLTLTEPSGIATGDLMIACIGYRSNAAFTVPGDWNLVSTQQSLGDTDATNGIASGLMMYCVRGGSAPTLTFNRTGGDVAQGRILAYSGGHATDPFDAGLSTTVNPATSAPAIASAFAVAAGGELLVAMVSCGDALTSSTFDAGAVCTIASGATDTTTAPTSNTWIERADTTTATGADHGLAIADGVSASSGNIQPFATVTASARHVIIAGAFKPAASGAALAGSIDAASTVSGTAKLTFSLSGAVNAASTGAGILQNRKDLAGQLDAASTVSGSLAISKQLAGSIDAASTVSGTLSNQKNLAGQIDAVSTVTGDLSVGSPPVELAGSINAASTVSGSVTITKILGGASNATSTVSGAARLIFSLGGTINGAATVSGSVGLTKNLAGQLAVQSTVSGSLGIGHNLAGAVNAQSSASAVLLVGNIQPLAGAVAAQSTVSGTVKLGMSLTGSLAAQSTAAGFLGQTLHLGGAVNAISTLDGSLRLVISLSGAANASATAQGILYAGAGYTAVPPLTYTLYSGRLGASLIADENSLQLTSGRGRVRMQEGHRGLTLDPGRLPIELEN